MPLYNAQVGNPVKDYKASGEVSNTVIKVWNDIVVPNTGNGYNVDISSAGFTTILSVQAQVVKSTSSATVVPVVSVQSYTTTQVSLNIVQGNTTLVSILGTTVNGLLFATNFSGMEIHLVVVGV